MSQVVREFNVNILRKSKPYGVYFFLLGLSFFSLGNPVEALCQWRLVKQLSLPYSYYTNPNRCAATIRFVNFSKWGIGFVGTSPGPENPDGGLWRSTESGATWYLTKRNKHPGLEGLYCTDITFKDSLTGWIVTTYSEYTPSAGMAILQTTDGGSEWNVVYTTGSAGSGAYGIYYAPHIDVLFCSVWDPHNGSLLESHDQGKSWSIAVNDHGLDGFAGNDSVIIVPGIGFPLVRSSDKGKTWHDVFMPNGETVDCWQPYADNKRNLWYLAEQGDGHGPSPSSFYVSTDLGETWLLRSKFDYYYYSDHDAHGGFDNSNGAVNGAVSGDDSGYVYIQMINGGMWRSIDTGKTWTSICGPSNKWDTRFTIFNNTIFAGDTNGIWALDLLTPQGIQIPQSVLMSGSNCSSTRSTVYFTSTYFCSGSVLLDSITMRGSSAFTTVPNYRRGEVSGKDSIFIDYLPQTTTDTGHVVFHFTENGIRRDSTVTLIGSIISPHLDITLTPTLTANNITAGSIAECAVYSSEQVEKRGLNSVTLDILYDNDLLEASGITSQSGITASFTTAIVTKGTARLPVTLTGTDMTIDKNAPLATVKFKTFLTDTTVSTIELSAIKLNNDDQGYKNCTLSATGNSTTFTQSSICGDSTMREYMRNDAMPIFLTSLRPNPTSADITVDFSSLLEREVILQVMDDLGRVVHEEKLQASIGTNSRTIPIPTHWSGAFYLRLQMGKDVVTSKFVKQ